MHELRIAREIICMVQAEMTRLNLKKVEKVNMRIGALSGIDSEALSFGFEASVADTSLDGARLVIKQVPIKGRCRACEKESEVLDFIFVCPHCTATDMEIIEGEELDIDSLIGERYA